MNDELMRYQEKLEELLYSESPDIFANYSQSHARCIIRTFFSVANDTILCLSGDFGDGVYGEPEIEDELCGAVRRGVKIEVISLGTSEKSRERLRQLKQRLDTLSESGRGSFSYKLGVVTKPGVAVQHYMVVDGKRYRLEKPHPIPVTEDVHAEVCCNGPAKSAVIKRDFDSIWGRLKFPA